MPDAADLNEIERRLGHDLFRYRRRMQIDWPSSVREGFAEAAGRSVATQAPDRFVKKWLQLRWGALERGRAVDESVTPELLQSIDVPRCPVMRSPLTHGLRQDSDWSVDRLNNDGAYAVSNLVVMSALANRAKGARSFDQVMTLADRNESTDGLTPVQWLRLAGLMLGPCFATRPQEAPMIPMTVELPPRTLATAGQIIQQVFVSNARLATGKNKLIRRLMPACRNERAQWRLRELAEAVHACLKSTDEPWDVWLMPETMRLLGDWRACLDDQDWAQEAHTAASMISSRVVSADRLGSWHLAARGYTP